MDSCLAVDPTGTDCRWMGILISDWDVSRVTDMYGLFSGAEEFNADLSSWSTAAVTRMDDMFYKASAFNGDLSSWKGHLFQLERSPVPAGAHD